MNKALLYPNIQEFIKNYKEDIPLLAFKGSPFPEVSIQELLQQIEGYQRVKHKLTTWHETKNIYYPPKINLEQTSSQLTAAYKASLIYGETMADITGGFGVDCYFFSKKFNRVYHFEQHKELSKIAAHNFKELGAKNIVCNSIDGIKAIEKSNFDVIYADPARRHQAKGKVVFLRDCEPNVVAQSEYLLKRCKRLMIKTSPMLDISAGVEELTNVSEIHIVAVRNEVKELLWILTNEKPNSISVKTINMALHSNEEFMFIYGSNALPSYSAPLHYLYEPNAALMKSGAFAEISKQLNIYKLALHSHLYTTKELIDFPGRIFNIKKIIPYQKKEMRLYISGGKVNVTCRNFPETVQQLRKKWKLKEGGDRYLFFTQNSNNEKIVLECSKLNS